MKRYSLSVKMLAILLCSALLLSLIPVFVIAFYNHPYYDDYGYTVTTRETWRQTGNVWETLLAAIRNVISTRQTWETNYSNTFLHSFQPTTFGEDGYWLCTFLITGMLLAALGFAVHLLVRVLLNGSLPSFWAIWASLSITAVHFVPCAKETFFWNSGGMAYTFLWSIMIIRICCLVRLQLAFNKRQAAGWYAAAFLLTLITGGSKFTTLLFALLIDGCLLLLFFKRRAPRKWAQLFLTLILVLLFCLCLTGEGNSQRAKTMQSNLGAVKAIAEALYFGMGLFGNSFSLQSCFVWLISVLVLFSAVRDCSFCFPFPWAATVLCVLLFCAQLAPTVYTGLYLGDGRVVNSYYFTFLLLSTGLILYWFGWLLHRFAKIREKCLNFGEKHQIPLKLVLIAAALLFIGTIGFRPEGALSYGPQNTTGGSALRSLLDGSAVAFDAAMDKRMALLEDESQTDVELELLTGPPDVFMGDSLDVENQEYVLNLYTEYFHKNSVVLKGGE